MLVDILDWARLPEDFRREIERRHVVVHRMRAEGTASARLQEKIEPTEIALYPNEENDHQ